MANRIFELGVLLFVVGTQVPVFAASKGRQHPTCAWLADAVKISAYQATRRQGQKYVLLRSYPDRQRICGGETADLMKRCRGTALAATAISGPLLLREAEYPCNGFTG